MTTPRYGYRPWFDTSQVNETRIVARDDTPTLAELGEDRKGIGNAAKLLSHLSKLAGSKGNWKAISERRYAASGLPPKRVTSRACGGDRVESAASRGATGRTPPRSQRRSLSL